MVNKVILVGHLGQDPEVRHTQSKKAVTTFSLATNHRYKDSEGEKQEQTEWHRVVCFGRLADIAGQYLARGRQVYLEGRIQTRSWEDVETGETRSRVEIVCERLEMLGRGKKSQGNGSEQSSKGPDSDPESAPNDDDIPF